MFSPLRSELGALLRLTAPLLVTGMGQMMLGIVDTAIVGRLGEVELGAVGLGNNIYFTVAVLGLGWMLALDPLVAQAVGAGEPDEARSIYWQGIWVAGIGTLPLSLAIVAFTVSLGHLGVPAETVGEAVPYLLARAVSIFPFLVLIACRSFLQAHEITRPMVTGVVVANALNVPLSYALVFGVPQIGFSGYGAMGAGIASAIATVVQAALLINALRAIWGEHRGYRPVELAVIKKLLKLGTPIGLQLVAEVGSFAIVAVLMGNLGTRALGSHQVALTLISFTFQLAIALGSATSVRVGHAIGKGDARATRRSGLTGIAAGGVMMLFFSACFLTFPAQLARVLTDEMQVVYAAVPLLAVAAAFQVSDGVQAVAAAALRGAGDTRWPLASNIVGHYAIGLPLGAVLAFGFGFGAVGLWWGLSAGLTAVAIALTVRFWVISRRPILRA